MKNIFFGLLVFSALSLSCTKEEDKKTYSDDYRWMDRKIYLSDPNINDPFRNNFFQKEKVKEAIIDLATNTNLGPNYFTFEQVPESQLEPIIEADPSVEFKSFILIWPDETFNAFVEQKLGANIPDQNAVTVVNAANKKQFYIIIRGSCAEVKASCSLITDAGFKSLIARQMGLLVGLKTNCTNSQNVMCQNPSDTQFLDVNRFNHYNSFNNMLENIINTPNFYN